MLTHQGTRELHTERLRLRKYLLSDSEAMYKNYATDERVARFMTWKPYKCIESLSSYISTQIDSYTNDNVYHWAIELNNEVIGGIGVYFIDKKNHTCEIGYCIGYDFWNKGIISEASLAVMGFLFGEVGMYRIMAIHDVENPASGKVMIKCGMAYEGKLRKHFLRHDGSRSDALVYGILKDEFINTQKLGRDCING